MSDYNELRKTWRTPLIREVFRVMASYTSSGCAESFTRKEGRVHGLLSAIHVMDHQGHLPDEDELKRLEGELFKKHTALVEETIEMATINEHLYPEVEK